MRTINIDPITRIEGHLRVEITVEGGRIVQARCSGALFRGLEFILIGRFPPDAQRLTTRICGVCPIAHATAASLALDQAAGVLESIPQNAWLLRNLIYAANWLHNHVLHFYHLALPDYIDASHSPLSSLLATPGEDHRFSQEENGQLLAHYLQALEVRRKAHELVALLGGKMPHEVGIVPGGVASRPTLAEIVAFRHRLREIRAFLEGVYLKDVLLLVRRYQEYFRVGRVGRLLSFGAFPDAQNRRLFPAGVWEDGHVEPLVPQALQEDLAFSRYLGESGHPSRERAQPAPQKQGAYSWIKAPRYRGKAFEVGPAARALLAIHLGVPGFQGLAEDLLREAQATPDQLSSVMGRHLARAMEALFLAGQMERWLDLVDPHGPVALPVRVPREAAGQGLTDAPRGALGHWLRIEQERIAHYQVISPTTWNASPRDELGQPGPIEQALEGTPVRGDGLLEAGRIVRSFDPCLACAVQ
ncbi:MAG: nickel-dependent hydrogenase large subunit [Candidatus Bipolaricaulaceae bacterium]